MDLKKELDNIDNFFKNINNEEFEEMLIRNGMETNFDIEQEIKHEQKNTET